MYIYIYEFEYNHSFAQMQVACKIYKVWLPFLEDNKQKHVFKNKTHFKTRLVDILCHFTSSFLIENRVVWKIAYWLRENWQFQRNLLASCFWNDPWNATQVDRCHKGYYEGDYCWITGGAPTLEDIKKYTSHQNYAPQICANDQQWGTFLISAPIFASTASI